MSSLHDFRSSLLAVYCRTKLPPQIGGNTAAGLAKTTAVRHDVRGRGVAAPEAAGEVRVRVLA
jgi:hypothetical protein